MAQSSDPIIQTKICSVSGKEFSITQGDLDFYEKISPTFAGQKFQIPTPTLCPEERQRRRLAFRNERNLYRRTCDASGKQIISMYRPNNGYKIYDQKVRYSDSWNALDYGQQYDFSKTFTENFKTLLSKVPKSGMVNFNCENSDYCIMGIEDKNCYMAISCNRSEGCLYGRRIEHCEFCVDCLAAEDCQHCSNSIQLKSCFACHYSCQCTNCSYCRGCFGLENKSFCIDNIQYTQEEYNSLPKAYKIPDPIKDLYYINNTYCEDSSLMFDTEQCVSCHDIRQSSHLRYCYMVKQDCHYCIDSTIYVSSELAYEAISVPFMNHTIGCSMCREGSDNYYSDNCFGCNNIFGCVGLRNKSYCIFNKQYTKEEYETLVAKIITHMQSTGEWGEFFHPSLSPFGYNETVAQEYYPLEKVTSGKLQAIKTGDLKLETGSTSGFESFGYHRSDYESPKPVSDKVIQGKDLPDTIDEVQDNILHYAIACEITGKLFRIQLQELVFYRKHKLPLPRKHPDQRHLERLALRK